MTVKELISALEKCDPDLVVAGYSYLDEGDFIVEEVTKARVVASPRSRYHRVEGFPCKGDSAFWDSPEQDVIILC